MVVQVIEHNYPDLTNKRIAGFDFDWTLVCPKGSTVWSCNRYDWKYLYKNCNEILSSYDVMGMTIVIVTYQSRTYKIEMLQDFLQQLDIPAYIIVSDTETQKNFSLKEYLKIDGDIDTTVSFYCGDADGEKGSWSDMDYKFAIKNNIQFFRPDQIFGSKNVKDIEFTCIKDFDMINNYDIIIMCGSPGSGKSTFVTQQVETRGFTVLSSDQYKSNKKKMAKELNSMISIDKKVVIDACNPTLENRNYWINIVKDKSYAVIYIENEKSIALERNNKRVNKVPQIAIHTWYKRFENVNIDMIVNNSTDVSSTSDQQEQLSITEKVEQLSIM